MYMKLTVQEKIQVLQVKVLHGSVNQSTRAFCPTCFCESVSRNGLQLSSSTIQIKKMKL